MGFTEVASLALICIMNGTDILNAVNLNRMVESISSGMSKSSVRESHHLRLGDGICVISFGEDYLHVG